MGGASSRCSEWRFLSAGRSPQSVSKVTEGCHFTACAISDMTQSRYSLNFGKTSCGPPGSTTAAAPAAGRPGELHLHGCGFVEQPFVRTHRAVLSSMCWQWLYQSWLSKETWEEKSAFEKMATSVSWRGKWVLSYWNSLVSLELFLGCCKVR